MEPTRHVKGGFYQEIKRTVVEDKVSFQFSHFTKLCLELIVDSDLREWVSPLMKWFHKIRPGFKCFISILYFELFVVNHPSLLVLISQWIKKSSCQALSISQSLNLSLSLRDRDRADTIITFHHHPPTENFLST